MSASVKSAVSCMCVRQRSLGERQQEHDKSVKEGDSKPDLIQHQVKTGHVVITKPVIKEVRE